MDFLKLFDKNKKNTSNSNKKNEKQLHALDINKLFNFINVYIIPTYLIRETIDENNLNYKYKNNEIRLISSFSNDNNLNIYGYILYTDDIIKQTELEMQYNIKIENILCREFLEIQTCTKKKCKLIHLKFNNENDKEKILYYDITNGNKVKMLENSIYKK